MQPGKSHRLSGLPMDAHMKPGSTVIMLLDLRHTKLSILVEYRRKSYRNQFETSLRVKLQVQKELLVLLGVLIK